MRAGEEETWLQTEQVMYIRGMNEAQPVPATGEGAVVLSSGRKLYRPRKAVDTGATAGPPRCWQQE